MAPPTASPRPKPRLARLRAIQRRKVAEERDRRAVGQHETGYLQHCRALLLDEG